jgi:isopenicillin N synthase-like dioxygenase
MARSTDEADFKTAARAVALSEIPVIDFAAFRTGDIAARKSVAKQIAEASEAIGFFYLRGHGVDPEIRRAIFAQWAAFFRLSQDAREEARATPDRYRGLMSLSQEVAAGQQLFEQYRVQEEYGAEPDKDPAGIFYGPNRWPSALPGMEAAAMRYFSAVSDLALDLLRAFALGIDLPEDRFTGFFRKPLSQLSLVYYSALPQQAAVDFANLPAHTDESPFTILAQGEVSGLEVRRRDGVWIAAPPIDDSFVINIGDMMMWWSNGRYLSNRHRVRNTSNQERFSIPFFINPDFDADVGPLPELAEADGHARYPAISAGAHLMRFYKSLSDSGEPG